MAELSLKHGPLLVSRRWVYDDEAEAGSYVETDVTDRAAEYLFESVTLDADVTLSDIFGLLEAAPVLLTVLRRDYAVELLAEARKGLSPTFVPGYAPDAIEFLELYQLWNLNSSTREYQPIHRLSFHGIGYELREALDEGHGCVYQAGHRINWGISTSPIREMLTLPVRLKPTVCICEDDLDAKKYGYELETVELPEVGLGQVLNGVLWELSFHGAPEEAQEFREELVSRVDEVRSGTAELVSGDDFFEEMDSPGIAALFDSIGSYRKREVSFALRKLEDDEVVQGGLTVLLDDSVQVKPEFAETTAKAFRKLFREARHPDEDETVTLAMSTSTATPTAAPKVD